MKVTVEYCGQVRQLVGTESDVGQYPEGMSLCHIVANLADRHGAAFRNMLFDETGKLRPSLLVAINGRAIDKKTPASLADGDVVTLLPPIGGG